MSSFPTELNSAVADFHKGLKNLETSLEPIIEKQSRTQLLEEADTSLDKAKVDIAAAYTLNSLVWMWMKTKGENPKESEVKAELDRVKAAMLKAKEIQDRDKRTKVDAPAAKRFVKNSLWQPKKKTEGAKEDQPRSKKSKK